MYQATKKGGCEASFKKKKKGQGWKGWIQSQNHKKTIQISKSGKKNKKKTKSWIAPLI